ncbi:monocarboxylate permease-like protein [Hyaloscypha variabilis]
MEKEPGTNATVAGDSSSLEKGTRKISNDDIQEQQPKHAELPDLPEGGTKAYLAVVGAFAGMFVSFGWVNCLAIFQAEYQTNQLKDYTSSEVSWITSTEFFCMLFVSPLSGRLFDQYGPRLPIAIGSFMHVFGIMMTSLSTKYYQFVLNQSICSGIGASLIFTPVIAAPMTYFRKRRAIAGGLAVAGSSLGGVIFPLMVVHLLPKVGFPWTMRICAFLILGLLIVTNLTISSYLQHKPRPFKLSQYIGPLRELNFLLMCICSFFLYWGMFVPLNYIVTSAIHDGMSITMAFNLIPILNGASFIGRTLPNVLADKYGRFNVMTLMILFSTIIVLGLWLPGHSHAAIIVFAALFGIGSGACIGLGPVLIMNISPMQEAGYRMGTVMAIAGLGTLTSPPIGGAIVARHGGSYVFACVFSGVSYLVSLLGILVLRGRVAEWKVAVKV